jgi:hypothetical protein
MPEVQIRSCRVHAEFHAQRLARIVRVLQFRGQFFNSARQNLCASCQPPRLLYKFFSYFCHLLFLFNYYSRKK